MLDMVKYRLDKIKAEAKAMKELCRAAPGAGGRLAHPLPTVGHGSGH
jgi:hypothetical protein